LNWAIFLFLFYLVGPARYKPRPIKPTPNLAIYHPPKVWAHVSVNHSPLSSPFFPPPRIRTAPGDRAAAARTGWDALPVRPARTPRDRCARTRVSRTRPRAGFSSFAPAPHTPATWPARRRAVPPRPPGRSKPGQPGVFTATLAALGFKGKGRLRPGCPSHQPLRGVLFLLL
jgi:hypothetical protein